VITASHLLSASGKIKTSKVEKKSATLYDKIEWNWQMGMAVVMSGVAYAVVA